MQEIRKYFRSGHPEGRIKVDPLILLIAIKNLVSL